MPNKQELSNAYKAGYDCVLVGPNKRNCHFSLFNSREATKMWEAGNQDAINKLIEEQTKLDKLGQGHDETNRK